MMFSVNVLPQPAEPFKMNAPPFALQILLTASICIVSRVTPCSCKTSSITSFTFEKEDRSFS